MQRYSQLSERKSQHLSSARAACANKSAISNWFEKVGKFFDDIGLRKESNFMYDYEQWLCNVDESGFCLGATSRKILLRENIAEKSGTGWDLNLQPSVF